MLTKKAKYALRAMFFIAQNNNKPVITAEIAEHQQIPKKFLETILIELRKHGLLYNNRGRIGGYKLTRKPEEISLGQVIDVIDGTLSGFMCSSGDNESLCQGCVQPENCKIRQTMLKVQDATAHILNTTTISDAIMQEKDRT
jgi:Rrf2 family protein